jgi:ATP-binding cassette subfamily B protein
VNEHIQLDNLHLLKRILPFFSKYKKSIITSIAFIPIIAGLQGVQPLYLKMVVDTAINHNRTTLKWWVLPATMFVLLVILFFLRIWQNKIVQEVGQNFVSDIRAGLFRHLQALNIDYFEKTQTGKLITRLTNDIESLSETFTSGVIGGANDVILLIGTVGFMFYVDWRLTLVQLIFIPLLIGITRIYENGYRYANLESRKELAQLNSLFQETLNGMQVIKLFNVEQRLSADFKTTNINYMKANDKAIKADSSFSAVIELIGILAVIGVIIAFALLFDFDKGSAGKLVAFVSYSQMLFSPIRSISEKFSVFQAGFTSCERIVSLLDEKPSIITLAQNDSIDEGDYGKRYIKFKNISFKYNEKAEKNILNNINFELTQGKSLGIVGRTGSGKSTLIKLICRFYDPTFGEVFLDGRNLRNISPQEVRKKIVMVPQRSFLFSGTILDNLVLDKRNLPMSFIEKTSEETGLINLINDLEKGFNTELREGGVDISSGQKQLISLTRALIQEPEILILDEATSNLDNFTEQQVNEAMKRVIHSGRTVILIAHRLNLVTECNQIIVIHNGEIKEAGTHEELMNKKGTYSHLISLNEVI